MNRAKPILILTALLWMIAGRAFAGTFIVDPRATYLRDDTGGTSPFILPLETTGFAPGDFVFIASVGNYDPWGGGQPQVSTGGLAMFSASATLLGANVLDRVPGALSTAATVSTAVTWNGTPTDIPQDFSVGTDGIIVRIPVGATHLFFGASDSHLGFNSDPDRDYGFTIADSRTVEVSLSVRAGESDLIVEWPAAASAYDLQFAENLAGTIDWRPVDGQVVYANGKLSVTFPSPTGERYFRLKYRID